MLDIRDDLIRAVNDFDNIKSAIESKGVTVNNSATSEYGNLIKQIETGSEPVLQDKTVYYDGNEKVFECDDGYDGISTLTLKKGNTTVFINKKIIDDISYDYITVSDDAEIYTYSTYYDSADEEYVNDNNYEFVCSGYGYNVYKIRSDVNYIITYGSSVLNYNIVNDKVFALAGMFLNGTEIKKTGLNDISNLYMVYIEYGNY